MKKQPSVYLERMLDYAEHLAKAGEDRTREDLDTDYWFAHGVSKVIEQIGEEASKLSEDYTKKYAQIPWHKLRGMRNILVHQYFEADLDILWTVITVQVPTLLPLLREALKREQPE